MRTLSRSLFIAVLILFRSACVAQDVTNGLVAHWTFCGCSAKDQTGHGHNGTASGNPACVTGIFDQGYQFSGSNTIDVPYDPAFNISGTGALTLTAWVKPTNLTSQYEALFVKGTNFWDYGLYINQGTPKFMFGCNAPNHEVFSKTILQNNQWYFVAGVYDNTKWKIYVNGLPEDSLLNGTPVYQSTNGIGFAKKGAFSRDYFTGVLDELRMYDRALSDDEVLQLYNYKPVGSGLNLSASIQKVVQENCYGVDTNVRLNIFGGCGAATGRLDSLWITGSSTWLLRNAPKYPSTIATIDSIRVRYNSKTGSTDTSQLHIRFDIGAGPQDTVILLIGKGYTETPYLFLSTSDEYIVQHSCTALDTFVSVSVLGRCIGTGVLDSVWLTGSSVFNLLKVQAVPRQILPKDYVGVRYSPSGAGNDTAVLHLSYDIGKGSQDTVVVLAGKGHSDSPTVLFSSSNVNFSQRTCDLLDTSISIQVQSCRSDTLQIDTCWLTGSGRFSLSFHALPWRIALKDLLALHYSASASVADTAFLHLRYNLAGKLEDTLITLIGRAGSPFLGGPSFQHLVVRSGAIGDQVTIPMMVDIGDSASLKASWSNLKSITSNISFDRTQLVFLSVSAPTGWVTTSVNDLGTSIRIITTNLSGIYSRPLHLGDGVFKIIDRTNGIAEVSLDNLNLHIGQNDNAVCLSQSEDALWGIVARPSMFVTESERRSPIAIQPNPFNEQLQMIGAPNDITSIQMFDVLGHRLALDISASGEIRTTDLPSGPYLLICHTRKGIQTFHLTKLR